MPGFKPGQRGRNPGRMSSLKFGKWRFFEGTWGPYRLASGLIRSGGHGAETPCDAASVLAHLLYACRSRALVLQSAWHVVFTQQWSHAGLWLCTCVCACACACLCVVEGKEEVCPSLRLCACLWRRGCACFSEEGGVGRAAGWVFGSSNAVSPFVSGGGVLRATRWTFPGELLVVWSSCGESCCVITFLRREAEQIWQLQFYKVCRKCKCMPAELGLSYITRSSLCQCLPLINLITAFVVDFHISVIRVFIF